jgi:hypothetical protein
MQQKNRYTAAFITSLVGIAIISWFMFVVYRNEGSYKALEGAIVMVCEITIFLITGLTLLTMKKTRPIGQGILIGTGITLVIGFGICSAAGMGGSAT